MLQNNKKKFARKTHNAISKKSLFNDLDTEPLAEYPHGYYSSYISVRSCGQFDDELTWFVSYFKSLQEKNLSTLKDLIYE